MINSDKARHVELTAEDLGDLLDLNDYAFSYFFKKIADVKLGKHKDGFLIPKLEYISENIKKSAIKKKREWVYIITVAMKIVNYPAAKDGGASSPNSSPLKAGLTP